MGLIALAGSACSGGQGLGRTGAAGAKPDAGAAGTPGSAGASGADGAPDDGNCFTDPCDGLCKDVASDPANCGACGIACPATSVCVAGKCGPTVKTLVPAAPGCDSIQLAVANGTLYWTDRGHGTVKSLPLDGSTAAPTTLAGSEKAPGLIEANGSNAFWIDVVSSVPGADMYGAPLTTAKVRRFDASSGALTSLAAETNSYGGIRGLAVAQGGGTVYYSAETNVKAVPVGGGTPIEVGKEPLGGVPTALGIDGDVIGYVADIDGNVDVITVKAGANAICGSREELPQNDDPLMINCTRIGGCTPGAVMERFIVRGTNVYWADGSTVFTGAIVGDKRGWKIPVARATFAGETTGLAGAADAIYFAEDLGGGTIEKTSYAPDSTAIPLARGQDKAHALVVDATNVYWTTSDCAIKTIAR